MSPREPLALQFFGVSSELPQVVLLVLIFCALYLFVIYPLTAAYFYWDRKIGADLQARVGPNRAGRRGVFQPLADLLKSLQKNSKNLLSKTELLWLLLICMALYSTLAVLPLSSLLLFVDTDLTVFIPLAISLIIGLGALYLGFAQKRITGYFGGIRILAQVLAGFFPALISLISLGVATGTYRWSEIARSQGFNPLDWGVLANPFQVLAFFVFFLSGLVCFSIAPLDPGFSKRELRGGIAGALAGVSAAVFQFGRFYALFLWAVLSVGLFLGAWNLPQAVYESLADGGQYWWIQVLELVTVLVKSAVLIFFVTWVGRVNPRIRVDQATDFGWRVLSPLSLVCLIGSTLWVGGKILF